MHGKGHYRYQSQFIIIKGKMGKNLVKTGERAVLVIEEILCSHPSPLHSIFCHPQKDSKKFFFLCLSTNSNQATAVIRDIEKEREQ